ncbi:hypothetical protein Sjap_007121 [Stephania japonica]|uniref:MADS-box domain-containing protein n=1 Tax=Stephania japonica TaxID=461633 RepID=A0AAP0JM49_9MAGN
MARKKVKLAWISNDSSRRATFKKRNKGLMKKRVMGRFAELPHKERTKRMLNQEGFLRHTSSKLKEQVKRQQRENREQDMTLLMYQCLGGDKALHQYLDSPKDLHCLGTSVDHIINQDYETMNLDVAMEALQSQSWFKSIINSQSSAHDPPHQINYNYNAGDDDLEPLLWGY